MSRGNRISLWRPVVVWSVVTVAAAAAARAVPGTFQAVRSAHGSDGVTDLLVAVCASALALALAWLWVITTLTVASLRTVARRTGDARGGATRRLVLVACGVAVVAGTGVPAMASGGDGRDLLHGLALPERAVAPAQQRAAKPARSVAPTAVTPPRSPDTYVVRPGDSLWSIALTHPGEGGVDHRWRALWQVNRDVVGPDPDVILPGQVLRLPPTPTTPTSDGDRR